MSEPHWKDKDPPATPEAHPGGKPVNQDWALPVGIYVGEPGSGTAEVVSDGRPLPVDVKSWPQQLAITPARRRVSAGFIAAAAGAYAAADVVSNSVTDTLGVPLKFAGVVDAAGQVAILDAIVAKCSEDSVLWRLAIDFYDQAPLPAEVEMDDNIALDAAKTVAGYGKFVKRVPLVAMADMGTAMAFSNTPNLREMLRTVTTDLWGVVVTLDAEVNQTAGMRIDFDLYFLN